MRFLVLAVASALTAATILAAIPVLFGSPQAQIHIQWRDVNEVERVTLEQQFALTESTRLTEDTWSYVPTDISAERLGAIVRHPAVVDTSGIDRFLLRISHRPPLTPRRGGLLEAPRMARSAKLLGYLLAGLAAVLLGWAALVTKYLADRRRLSTLLVVFSGALTASFRFLAGSFNNDHFVHLAAAQQMFFGDWPTRDFIDIGRPLQIVASAVAQYLLGHTLFAEAVLVGAAFGIAAALTAAIVFKLTGSLVVSFGAVLVEVAAFPRTYHYPKLLATAAGLWLIGYFLRRPSFCAADPDGRRGGDRISISARPRFIRRSGRTGCQHSRGTDGAVAGATS